MENNTTPAAEEKKVERKTQSREPLFGVLLLILMFILVLGFLVGLGWTGYATWKNMQTKENQPSISNMGEEKKEEVAPAPEETKPAEETKPTEEKPAPTETPVSEVTTKAKGTAVSVLNGGAAKGSAGVLTEVLKKEGFTKATAGNTLGDYTGTVVYFASGLDKEAEVVKVAIMKTYPQATVKAADTKNTETTVSPITVILGK